MTYSYEYPRPALTVDIVIFGYQNDSLYLLLIKRALEPFLDHWAIPGGFVLMDEELDTAAKRELKEETGVSRVFLEQLYTFGGVKRDPRGRVVTVAYYALINMEKVKLSASTDAKDAQWFPINKTPKLAFDHQDILKVALDRLRGKIRYEPIGFELLPNKFSLTELQRLYEVILDVEIDKRNFRKKLLGMDLLIETDEYQQNVSHRKAKLYQFDKKKYEKLKKEGFYFEF